MPQAQIHDIRSKIPETEKLTVNLGYVDLGHIDLMVHEGFYSNRSDFIRTAVRNQIARHSEVLDKSVARNTLELGLRHYSRADLEQVKSAREQLHVNVLGLVTIAADVSADLALETIASITVLGALHASPGVKAALADRIR